MQCCRDKTLNNKSFAKQIGSGIFFMFGYWILVNTTTIGYLLMLHLMNYFYSCWNITLDFIPEKSAFSVGTENLKHTTP